MPEDSGLEAPDPQQPNETREDYLVRIERSKVRDMETKAKDYDSVAAERDALRREVAFAKAGIDMSSDDAATRYFVKGYDGELDPAKIRAEAEAARVLNPSTTATTTETQTPAETPPPDTQLEPGEAGFTQERRDLATSSPPDQAPPAEPYKAAREIHDRVLADGGMEKHAVGSAINSLVNAAHSGDERVVISRRRGL